MSEEVNEDAAAAEDPNGPPMGDDMDEGATQVVDADDLAAAVHEAADDPEPSPFDEPAPEPAAEEPSPFDEPAPAMAAAAAAAEEPSPFDDPPADEAPPPTPDPEPVVEKPVEEPKPKKKKRKKIDLKSRLSSVRASGSMAARPSATGAKDRKSDPFPPPPGGVPAPRIGSKVSAPLVSSPFAPPEPEKKVTAEAQTIKVEVGEEIQQERKRASKKAGLYAVIAALVAGALGFFIGGTAEKSKAGNKAVEGASALATDIKTANDKMSELSTALRKAVEALSTDEYPSELGDTLKTMNVPFGAENFQGKGVGGLPPDVFNMLVKYTKGVAELNEKKDLLRNVLSRAEKPVKKYLEEKEKPRMKFSVLFNKNKKGVVAEFVQIKEPFEVKQEEWPEEFTVLQRGEKGKAKETKVKLLKDEKAKIVGSDDKWAAPLDGASVPALGEQQIILQLRKALNDTKELIDGNQSPVPSQQTDGLVKEGDRLIEGLTKISNAG